jgi:hypothetical protein
MAGDVSLLSLVWRREKEKIHPKREEREEKEKGEREREREA